MIDWAYDDCIEYCRHFEDRLRQLRADGATPLSVSPIVVDDYLDWCQDLEEDPAVRGPVLATQLTSPRKDGRFHGRRTDASHAGAVAVSLLAPAAGSRVALARPVPSLAEPSSKDASVRLPAPLPTNVAGVDLRSAPVAISHDILAQ